MATVINLNEKQNPIEDFKMPGKLRELFEQRKNAKREPLTPDVLRKGQGLENLTDKEAIKAIDSIKKLAAILFEITCHNESICIDNQHVVHLKKQNNAA